MRARSKNWIWETIVCTASSPDHRVLRFVNRLGGRIEGLELVEAGVAGGMWRSVCVGSCRYANARVS